MRTEKEYKRSFLVFRGEKRVINDLSKVTGKEELHPDDPFTFYFKAVNCDL